MWAGGELNPGADVGSDTSHPGPHVGRGKHRSRIATRPSFTILLASLFAASRPAPNASRNLSRSDTCGRRAPHAFDPAFCLMQPATFNSQDAHLPTFRGNMFYASQAGQEPLPHSTLTGHSGYSIPPTVASWRLNGRSVRNFLCLHSLCCSLVKPVQPTRLGSQAHESQCLRDDGSSAARQT